MERTLRTALRAIKASGQTLELVRVMLEDAPWATIVGLRNMVKDIERNAFLREQKAALDPTNLMDFRAILYIDEKPYPVDILGRVRSEDTLTFRIGIPEDLRANQWQSVAIFTPHNFCFGTARKWIGESIVKYTVRSGSYGVI